MMMIVMMQKGGTVSLVTTRLRDSPPKGVELRPHLHIIVSRGQVTRNGTPREKLLTSGWITGAALNLFWVGWGAFAFCNFTAAIITADKKLRLSESLLG